MVYFRCLKFRRKPRKNSCQGNEDCGERGSIYLTSSSYEKNVLGFFTSHKIAQYGSAVHEANHCGISQIFRETFVCSYIFREHILENLNLSGRDSDIPSLRPLREVKYVFGFFDFENRVESDEFLNVDKISFKT